MLSCKHFFGYRLVNPNIWLDYPDIRQNQCTAFQLLFLLLLLLLLLCVIELEPLLIGTGNSGSAGHELTKISILYLNQLLNEVASILKWFDDLKMYT